jgi:hypothetical protein
MISGDVIAHVLGREAGLPNHTPESCSEGLDIGRMRCVRGRAAAEIIEDSVHGDSIRRDAFAVEQTRNSYHLICNMRKARYRSRANAYCERRSA